MANSNLSRRDFLLRIGAAGALGTGAVTLLSACGGGESGTTPAPPPEPEAAAAGAGCTDLSGLTEQEVTMRTTTYKYVDQTPDPEKACHLCALFVPAAEGAACASCNLVKGPIDPNGTCISFAPKQTA